MKIAALASFVCFTFYGAVGSLVPILLTHLLSCFFLFSSHSALVASSLMSALQPVDGRTPPNKISPATIERLLKWQPTGGPAVNPCAGSVYVDKVIGIGICQNVEFLIDIWQQYLAAGKEDSALISAFTQAFALTVRRCPSLLEPCVRQLVHHATALTPDTCVRLSHIISDLGARDIAITLIAKTNDIPETPRAFYLSILRLATEALNPPDMELAMDTVDQMVNKGFTHCTMSLRLMITGMSRLNISTVDPALRAMAFNNVNHEDGSEMSSCIAQTFFNNLDSVVGNDAKKAADYVQTLHPSVMHALISDACPYPPTLTKKGCFNACGSALYMVADPLTIDFNSITEIPADTYVVFLYSSLRHLELRATNLCASSPFHKKLANIKTFLSTFENSCVIPFQTELALRAEIDDTSVRPTTPQDRCVFFMAAIKKQQGDSGTIKIAALTTDPTISQRVAEHGIPSFTTLSTTVKTLPSPLATPPPENRTVVNRSAVPRSTHIVRQ
jgi:hypothetical protein